MSAKKNQKVALDTVNGIFVVSGFIAIFVVAVFLIKGGSQFSATSARNRNPGRPGNEIVCIDLYSPVCGQDGKTYSNDCYAKAARIPVACSGECPCGENGKSGPVRLDN